MQYIKNMVLILIITAFALNAYAVPTITLCMCEEMSGENMPCHEMTKVYTDAEQADDQIKQDQSQLSKCENCCGHCQVPTHGSIFNNNTSTDFLSRTMEYASYNDLYDSMHLYGIDYPPKNIS